ncbi:MAG: hypothetical protein Q4D96_11045 [Propionibacteriaceae bacterium]|nr:hypothetical protein [Propionibacteriaceae bacterium]
MSQHASHGEVLWSHDDDQVARLLTTHLEQHPDRCVTALFADEQVADLWAGQPGVTARAWVPILVRDVLAAVPPYPVERVAPPPVVVGDCPVARRLADEIAVGWRGGCAATHLEAPLHPSALVAAVSSLVEQWRPPQPKRGTCTGPTVYVAAGPEGEALAAARAVAAEVSGARVAVVLSGEIAWPRPAGVTVFTVAKARARAAEVPEDPTLRLARLLFEDAAWLSAPDAAATAPDQPLFSGISHETPGWDGQDERTRRQFLAVAEAASRVLGAAGVEVRQRHSRVSEVVLLDPSQLAAMAEQLLVVVGIERTPGSWLTALEVAARLPVLVVRSGMALSAPGDALLTPELVELLAPQVHLAYQEVSGETGNASGSPLAELLWAELSEFDRASNRATVVGCAVAHAALGLAWRRSTGQGGVDIEPHVARLGELEHRRWAIHERQHGRPDHKWAVPWERMDEGLKHYDLRIARAIPAILADAGLEVYSPGQGPVAT